MERDHQDHPPESKFGQLIKSVISPFRLSGERITKREAKKQLVIRLKEMQNINTIGKLTADTLLEKAKNLDINVEADEAVFNLMDEEVKRTKLEGNLYWIMALTRTKVDPRQILKAWELREEINRKLEDSRSNKDTEE